MSESGGKTDQLADKIEELVTEIEQINRNLCDLAQNSTSGGKIKTERVDWGMVHEVAERYDIWFNQALT